jgi:hypothetical protein
MNGHEDLKPDDAFRVNVGHNGERVLRQGVVIDTVATVAAEMRMHATDGVMPVMMVIDVRVQERRAQRTDRQDHAQTDGRQSAHHRQHSCDTVPKSQGSGTPRHRATAGR